MTLSGLPPERWPSGRRRSPAKGVYPRGYRGFESHLLRHHKFPTICFDDHHPERVLSYLTLPPARLARRISRQQNRTENHPSSTKLIPLRLHMRPRSGANTLSPSSPIKDANPAGNWFQCGTIHSRTPQLSGGKLPQNQGFLNKV